MSDERIAGSERRAEANPVVEAEKRERYRRTDEQPRGHWGARADRCRRADDEGGKRRQVLRTDGEAQKHPCDEGSARRARAQWIEQSECAEEQRGGSGVIEERRCIRKERR